jgi:hypothetical protein
LNLHKNVLLIVVDQWRSDALPRLGNKLLKVPNIDRLCREGVTFRNHFTQCAPCGPARASLLTGLYQMTHRAVQNAVPLDARFCLRFSSRWIVAQSGSVWRRWPCLVPTAVNSRASSAVSVSSADSGQLSPAAASRRKVNRTVDGATFSRHAISLPETPERVSRCAPPLPPVDPLHRNSLDFAGHLGRWPRNTIRHSSRPVVQRPERGKERRQLTEGEPDAALHRGLVRHETPSPV